MYVNHLTEIFREVKRITKPTGLFFLNIGDTYAGSQSGFGTKLANPKSLQDPHQGINVSAVIQPPSFTSLGSEPWIVSKQLLLIPYLVAHSLQWDGWILRRDIIWKKKSCLPSQVKDNFHGVYEHIFMFAKTGKYYFDQSKARQPYAASTLQRYNYAQSKFGDHESGAKCTGATKGEVTQVFITPNEEGGVKSDIWEMGTSNYHGQHFACFPEELVSNCIKPGCSREICIECGASKLEYFKMIMRQYDDLTEDEKKKWDKVLKLKDCTDDIKEKLKNKILRKKVSLGFLPSCKCGKDFIKGIVFDPFAGAGTTLIVSKQLGFGYCGVEMQPKYVKIIESRLRSMLD